MPTRSMGPSPLMLPVPPRWRAPAGSTEVAAAVMASAERKSSHAQDQSSNHAAANKIANIVAEAEAQIARCIAISAEVCNGEAGNKEDISDPKTHVADPTNVARCASNKSATNADTTAGDLRLSATIAGGCVKLHRTVEDLKRRMASLSNENAQLRDLAARSTTLAAQVVPCSAHTNGCQTPPVALGAVPTAMLPNATNHVANNGAMMLGGLLPPPYVVGAVNAPIPSKNTGNMLSCVNNLRLPCSAAQPQLLPLNRLEQCQHSAPGPRQVHNEFVAGIHSAVAGWATAPATRSHSRDRSPRQAPELTRKHAIDAENVFAQKAVKVVATTSHANKKATRAASVTQTRASMPSQALMHHTAPMRSSRSSKPLTPRKTVPLIRSTSAPAFTRQPTSPILPLPSTQTSSLIPQRQPSPRVLGTASSPRVLGNASSPRRFPIQNAKGNLEKLLWQASSVTSLPMPPPLVVPCTPSTLVQASSTPMMPDTSLLHDLNQDRHADVAVNLINDGVLNGTLIGMSLPELRLHTPRSVRMLPTTNKEEATDKNDSLVCKPTTLNLDDKPLFRRKYSWSPRASRERSKISNENPTRNLSGPCALTPRKKSNVAVKKDGKHVVCCG